MNKRLGLCQFTRSEELAHLPRVGRYGVNSVENSSSSLESDPRLIDRCLKLHLPLFELLDAGFELFKVEIALLDDIVEVVQAAAHCAQFGVGSLKLLPQVASLPVDFFVKFDGETADVFSVRTCSRRVFTINCTTVVAFRRGVS